MFVSPFVRHSAPKAPKENLFLATYLLGFEVFSVREPTDTETSTPLKQWPNL